MDYAVGLLAKKSLVNLRTKRLSPVFSSRRYIVLGLCLSMWSYGHRSRLIFMNIELSVSIC